MAYTKHEWTRGEVIASGLLNHMEDGIAAAQAAADKAQDAQELRAALDALTLETRAAIRALDERIAALEA